MANELTISASLRFVKGAKSVSQSKAGVHVTVAGDNYVTRTQVVGTSAEALDIGDITTPGYLLVKNNDATNFAEIRSGSSGADVVKISAGKFALFELATATPFAIADTAAVELEYTLIEA